MLDYPYFKENDKMIADVDPRAIQQTSFTANLDWAAGAIMFSIIEKAKETVLYFSQGTVKVS